MDVRLATIEDLEELKIMYQGIVKKMEKQGVAIWDDIYPYILFPEDIALRRLYVVYEQDTLYAAFALCKHNKQEEGVEWTLGVENALFLERFGVHADYTRRGYGSLALQFAQTIAKEQGAQFLRLLVVDHNKAAIDFYQKQGFYKAEGSYHERIDDELILHEIGFEINV